MKNLFRLAPFCILFILTLGRVNAQTTAGPSDGTTAPPTSAGSVNKVLCAGTPISISGPAQPSGADYASYQWYKLDASGATHQATTATKTYTESPSGPGYYKYQVQTVNATGCSSPISDVYTVYVLPALTATITTPSNAICADGTSTTLLTANPSAGTGYTYNYQWTRNGVAISGATSNTYAATESASGSVTYGVTVSYTLNSTCPASATSTITANPVPPKPTIN
jgi:hypothetical protein